MKDLAARLTEAASEVREALTTDEVAAIRRYQGLDRTYELVASVLRGLRSPGDLTAPEAELVTHGAPSVSGVDRSLARPLNHCGSTEASAASLASSDRGHMRGRS